MKNLRLSVCGSLASVAIIFAFDRVAGDEPVLGGEQQSQRTVNDSAAKDPQPKLLTLPEAPGVAPVDPELPAIFATCQSPRYYAEADYLFWWVKSAPLPFPVVTSVGSDGDHGLVAGANSNILYGSPWPNGAGGQDHQNFPGFSGTRMRLGMWLDNERIFGIEGSGFLLESQSAGTTIQSDANGNPNLRLVDKNAVLYTGGGTVLANVEDALPISVPAILKGNIVITNSLRLWGTGVTGLMSFYSSPSLQVTGLAGFRYYDLYESFDLAMNLDGIGSQGPKNFVGESGTLADHFQTRNQFYGGNAGLRANYQFRSWSFEATGNVSLGSNHETQNVNGGFTAVNFPTNGVNSSGPEGFYAQPANEGNSSKNKFAVIPEVQFKIGYSFTPWMRATVGYNFLYWNNVIRPTDQVDRYLPTGQTFLQNSGVSTVYPVRQFNTTDVYAQGLSFGLDFRS
jgi:hypothetical protein